MKRILILLCSLMLVGCHKEEVVETLPPYYDVTQLTFTVYEDNLIIPVEQGSVQEVSNTEVSLLHDNMVIRVDYIQGNSLNDYIEAYYAGVEDVTKTSLVDNHFQTSTTCYAFYKSANRNYVMISGPVAAKDYCSELLSNIRE